MGFRGVAFSNLYPEIALASSPDDIYLLNVD